MNGSVRGTACVLLFHPLERQLHGRAFMPAVKVPDEEKRVRNSASVCALKNPLSRLGES
jgi:hypothetical protein